jgi:hypothetical protein
MALSAVLLLALPGLAWALEEEVTLSPQEAAKLAMIVRAQASGPEAVGVELEFPATGELLHYRRVELDISYGKKRVLFTTLAETSSPAGHKIVGFTAARTMVPQIQLRVVTQDGLSRVARVLVLKDFVNVNDLR